MTINEAPILRVISQNLGIPSKSLADVIRTAPLRYKKYTIRKKNGGLRAVAQPAREVKAVQYWIMEQLEPLLRVHPACMSYRRKTSIRDNAAMHSQGRFLLKMDFTAFFPSIKYNDVYRLLRRDCELRFAEADLQLFARVLLWAPTRDAKLELCIGAPSSPLISNSVLYSFDLSLHDWCAARGVTYTRYADDLTFSCRDRGILGGVEEHVRAQVNQLESPQLSVNSQKTVHASRAGRRSVTGINVTPQGELSVGRDRKRLARAMYHRFTLGKLDQMQIERLQGLLSFIDHIEPGYSSRLLASTRTEAKKP